MSKERAAQLVDAGIWLKLSGDLEGARKLFERALKLDPENEKARQLVAGGDVPAPPPSAPEPLPSPIAPPVAPLVAAPEPAPAPARDNPFEPPAASPPVANQVAWNLATQNAPRPPPEPSLEGDWGRLTGASTPVPQHAPVSPSGPSEQVVKQTLPGWGHTPVPMSVRLGESPSPVPGPAPIAPLPPGASPVELTPFAATQQSRSSKHTMVQWSPQSSPSPVPQIAPVVPAPAPASSRPSRPTMSDWSTQVPGFPSPVPVAAPVPLTLTTEPEVVPVPLTVATEPLPPTARPAKPTMSDWSTQVPGSPSPVPQAAPIPLSLTAEPVPPTAVPGSRPSKPTMSDWSTQVPGTPSPVPQPPLPLTVAAPVEAPRAPRPTMNDWGQGPASIDAPFPDAPFPVAPPPVAAPPTEAGETMQQWGSQPVEPAPGPRPVRQTMSDWSTMVPGEAEPMAPLRLDAPVAPPRPEPAPRSTMVQWNASSESSGSRVMPPLFSGPASTDSSPMVVRIGGDPGPDVPPPSTPPLFSAPPYEEPKPPAREEPAELPLPGPAYPPAPPLTEPQRTFTEPMGYAWGWSASQQPPVEEVPQPRPSPSLSPAAESAWDARSNPGIKLEAVVGRDRALDLISSDSKPKLQAPTKKEEVDAILRGARDLLGLDDHTGAMELIQKAIALAPDDPEVIAMKERSEKTLLTMFESKLGKLEAVPRVLLKDDEIIWLNLDHRAGFVLAQIDGTVSFDDLFSVSGMSRIDTARILAQLVEEGVISRG